MIEKLLKTGELKENPIIEPIGAISAGIFDNEVKPQIIFLSHDEQLVMSMYQKGMDADYIVEYGKLLNIKNIDEMELTKRTIDVTEAIKYEYRNIYIHIYK